MFDAKSSVELCWRFFVLVEIRASAPSCYQTGGILRTMPSVDIFKYSRVLIFRHDQALVSAPKSCVGSKEFVSLQA